MNKKRDFLRVIDNKRCFYGGYQKWLIDESISTFFANRSCAVTAITNVILNKRNIVSKKYYSKKQVEVFKKIKPFIWGVPTVNILVKKTKKLNLKAFVFKKKWTKSNLLKYISFAITKENLVLMINWNSSISNLKYHWITITDINYINEEIVLTISNWGEKDYILFNEWFYSKGIYKAVVYFK